MTRFAQWFNFLGILALSALCAAQWRANRQMNLQLLDLQNTRIELLDKVSQEEKITKGYAADLDYFRTRLTLSESALKNAEDKSSALAVERDKRLTERDRLAGERDQLKANLEKWTAAVVARDAALKQSNGQITALIAERNAAVSKFNDLAEKYNSLVKNMEKTRAKK